MLLFARIALGKAGDWFSKTLVGELLVYLKTRYFTLQFGNYEHLPVTEDARKSLEWFLFALFLGVIVAVAAYLRHRAIASSLLSALKSHEATEEGSAKTLAELGLEKRPAIRRLLARPTPLSRAVLIAKEEASQPEATAEEVLSTETSTEITPTAAKKEPDNIPALTLGTKELSSARLFLPTEELESLEAHYRQKGHPALILAATILLSTVALALVFRFLPVVLGVVDSIL